MYEPPLHREDDLAKQHALIRARPLGPPDQSWSAGTDRQRHSLSRSIRPASRLGTLRAHVARANPQWRDLRENPEALVVFQGAGPLRLAVLVRDQAGDPQGRADLELRDGPGARTGACSRGRRMALAPDRCADRRRRKRAGKGRGRSPTRRRISSRCSAGRSSESKSRSPTSAENGRRARIAAPPTARAWSPASKPSATTRRWRWRRS